MIRALVLRHRRFVTFLVVGASGVLVNMAVYLGALSFLDEGGRRGLLATNTAAFLGWLVSVASNFVLNDRLTFRVADQRYAQRFGQRLLRYYGSASVAYAIQAAVLNGLLLAGGAWLEQNLPYPRALANLCGIGVATVVNYLLAKHWVFGQARESEAS